MGLANKCPRGNCEETKKGNKRKKSALKKSKFELLKC
jgi:hypothetical protein